VNGVLVKLPLMNLIRDRLAEWRTADYLGVSRTSLELLKYVRRDGRHMRQGIGVPLDEPGDDEEEEDDGYTVKEATVCVEGLDRVHALNIARATNTLSRGKQSSQMLRPRSKPTMICCSGKS